MSNAFQDRVGVTAEERVINAINLTPLGGTKNIGLLVERVRGVDGKILQTTDLKEDRRKFGDHSPNMYSSYVVESLFNNTGGYPVNVFQSRVVGQGSLPAKVTIRNASDNLQSFTHETTQNYNSNPATPQIDKLVLSHVGTGDTFIYTFNGDSGANGLVNEIFSVIATSDDVSQISSALVTAINEKMSTLGLNVTAEQPSGTTDQILVTSQSFPFTSQTTASNSGESSPILEAVAGYQGSPDKGTWGNQLRVRVYPIGHVDGSTDGYMLNVLYKGYNVETYISNGTDWQSLITAVNQRSEYIMLNAIDLTKELTLSVFDSALTGGVYNAPVEADFIPRYHEVTNEPLGLQVFEGSDVTVVACPEIFTSHFAKMGENFARNQRKFFVFNMPYLATESTLTTYFNALMTPDENFCAGYLNWIEVSADSAGNRIWIPAVGYHLGAGYVRKSALNNGYIWIPPAGIETVARGVYRITHDALSEDTISRYIKKWRCNTMKFIKNSGYITYSSRTYSTNTLFESIHVRIETNWIIDNLLTRNVKVLQNLISPSSMKTARIDNLVWFKNLYDTGGIEQSVKFEEAIIISIEQNKQNRKELEMDISWIPPECTEHIHIRLNRNDGIILLNFINS